MPFLNKEAMTCMLIVRRSTCDLDMPSAARLSHSPLFKLLLWVIPWVSNTNIWTWMFYRFSRIDKLQSFEWHVPIIFPIYKGRVIQHTFPGIAPLHLKVVGVLKCSLHPIRLCWLFGSRCHIMCLSNTCTSILLKRTLFSLYISMSVGWKISGLLYWKYLFRPWTEGSSFDSIW